MSKKNIESVVLDHSNSEYIKKKESMNSFFLDSSYIPMTLKQIKDILQVPASKASMFENIISSLISEGVIFEDDSKRFVVIDNKNFVYCKYNSKSSKFGFGTTNYGEDIYIERRNSLGAIDKDEVIVKITKQKSDQKKREGNIIKIVKHNLTRVIGEFIKSRNFGFVVSIDKKIDDVYIPKKYALNVKNGSFVEVEITKYSTNNSKAEGKIISVIDNKKVENMEVLALIKSYNLDINQNFNKFVNEELKNVPKEVTIDEIKNRVDRTNQKVFTIDGEDAKDLDDGVFVKKLDNGNYLLSVYIADVSHYVKSGSQLDMEAVRRGTSIYIPGQVIPMLPRKLSNGICSLNEGVNRLSLAIDMEIDSTGRVINNEVFKTVIKVTKRMSYTDVYKTLTGKIVKGYEDYVEDLKVMEELANILKSRRIKNGSINFDIPETKVIVDENYNVIDIKPYDKTFANDIIEEFMLAANMTIAKKFYFLNIPFIYRIHEKPDEEKIRMLNEFLANYKIRIKAVKNVQPKTIAAILDDFKDEENKKIVSTLALRTLKLAKYSEECLGHFGLAAKYYCHFTSPIRRYPDLFIHRVISDYIESNMTLSEEKMNMYKMQSKLYSISSSETEKNATIIERDFDDLYKAIYMKRYINQEFDGIISSVTSFGMFVTLDNTVEGMVPFDNMPGDDYYEYNEESKTLIGRKNKKIFKIGQKVKVRLVRVDTFLKEIDFSLEEE